MKETSTGSLPLVTVTFVAWKRIGLLKKGIESCLRQDYPNLEILVLDNSPTDEVYRWLTAEFPQVKAIRMYHPIPLPAARNILVATAKGELIVFHDDDSRFSSPQDVRTAVEYLRQRPGVACAAFRSGDGDQDWNQQFDGPRPAQTYTYIACAVMFRKADFLSAGGYFEPYTLYGEERVLSLGFFGLGKEIHFLPTVSIIHEQTSEGRVKDPGARYHVADIVMTPGSVVLKFPFPEVLWYYPGSFVWYALKTALLRKRPLVALKGIVDAIYYLPSFIAHRAPMPRRELRRWLATRRQYNDDYFRRLKTSGHPTS